VEERPQTHLRLIEKESSFAARQNSSNSRVIQSGIYYKKGFANGLKGIHFLNSREINEIEPYFKGINGINKTQTQFLHFAVSV